MTRSGNAWLEHNLKDSRLKQGVRLSLGVAGKAEEVGNRICVPFDVLAGQAMGAACDWEGQFSSNELNLFVMRRGDGKLSQLAEPADCGGDVAGGKDAVLFAPALLTLD